MLIINGQNSEKDAAGKKSAGGTTEASCVDVNTQSTKVLARVCKGTRGKNQKNAATKAKHIARVTRVSFMIRDEIRDIAILY